jgi:hypothetical protein
MDSGYAVCLLTLLTLCVTGAEFTKKGTIIIQSLKSNKAQFSQAASLSAEERKQLEVCFASFSLALSLSCDQLP